MPRGRRNNNPNASYLEKLTVKELREKCTRHGIKYMHVLKKHELIQKLEEHYKHVISSALIKHRHIQSKNANYKNKHILQEYIPKTREIGKEIDDIYNMLNDNNLLEGEAAAYYYNAHDGIIDILNECLCENPNEQEIKNLFKELNIERRCLLIYAEPTLKSFNRTSRFFNKPEIDFKFGEYARAIGARPRNNFDPIKSIISGHTLSSVNTNNTLPKNTIEPLYYNTINEIDPEFNEYKKQQRKKEGLGNRINKYNFTYNKIETQEEKEARKKERTEKEKKKKRKKKKKNF